MYTTDCKDPNCADCTETSSAQSSEEGSESEILKVDAENSEELLCAVEYEIHNHLESSFNKKTKWEHISRKLKDEVHTQIYDLMTVLRYREQELCMEIDRQYNHEVRKIDELTLFQAVEKIRKNNGKKLPPPSETIPLFSSDFEDLKNRLQGFGRLSFVDALEQEEEGEDVQKCPVTEELAPACSRLSLGEDEQKIDLNESKEKTVEPKKCEEKKIESDKKDRKIIAKRGRRLRNMKLRLPQEKDGKLPKEVDRLIVTRKDLLKEGEVQIRGVYGVKEKRSLNEKPVDPKLSGKRTKPSFFQPLQEKKKRDEMADRFQLLQSQLDLMRVNAMMKKINEREIFGTEFSSWERSRMLEDPFHERVLGCRSFRREPEKLSSRLERKRLSEDLLDECRMKLWNILDEKEPKWRSMKREPEKLSLQVRRKIDALNMKIAEEKLSTKAVRGYDGVIKPEERNDQLVAIEQESKELTEQLLSQKELMQKRLEEVGRVLEIDQDFARAHMEKQKREFEELERAMGWRDRSEEAKMVKKALGKEESSDEDSSSDLDMEIISRNEAASIPADASLSPPLPPKNRFKFLPKRIPKPQPSFEGSGVGNSESSEVKESSSSAEQPGQKPKNRFMLLLNRNPKPPSSSESSGVCESESPEGKENSSLSEQPGQEPKNRFMLLLKRNPKPPPSSESSGIVESESTEVKENSSFTEMKESSSSTNMKESSSSIEMKENSSSIEQPSQESSQNPNPTVLLRSSFTKYLEKNPESEWLAAGANLKPCSQAGMSKVELLKQEVYQWLH